jgi:hypothetical protein
MVEDRMMNENGTSRSMKLTFPNVNASDPLNGCRMADFAPLGGGSYSA